jgi:hypothetical protein
MGLVPDALALAAGCSMRVPALVLSLSRQPLALPQVLTAARPESRTGTTPAKLSL